MNWELLGHEWAVRLLKEHITRGGLRHAYLFTGPSGIGRRTLAVRLAQALNCPQPAAPGEPCRECRTCSQIERMQYADLTVIQAEQYGGVLKVDQVRELLRSVALSPYEGRYRVALFLNFENANPNAANALLKTLEEPPPQVILALTAESAESLLPTIVSRCEVLRLRPLPIELVSQGLQARWGLSPEQAQLLAHISSGRPGMALRFHREPERLEQRQVVLNDLLHLIACNRVERFAYAEALTKETDKAGLRAVLVTWLSFWRDVLMRSAESAAPLANLDRTAEIENLAAQWDLETIRCMISALERTFYLLDRNVNARLAFEVLLLGLPR